MKFVTNWLSSWIETFQRRKRHKTHILNSTFSVIPSNDDEIHLQFLKGVYAGIAFSIHNIRVVDDYGHVSFDIDVLDHDFDRDKQFDKTASEVFMTFVEYAAAYDEKTKREAVEEVKEGIDDNDQDRDAYSEEPDDQRVIQSKNTSLLEQGSISGTGGFNPLRGDREAFSRIQQSTKVRKPPSSHH